MNISEALLSFAYRLGVDVAFCLTGGMSMHLNRALHDLTEIKTIFVNHETAAIAAADGYSRSFNLTRPGLAVITSGPAVTNCVTGLASAFGDSVPLIVLAGQVKRNDINRYGVRTHGVQEVNQIGLTSHVSSFSARVDEHNLVEVLETAWSCLTSGRRGPVFLEVPLDVQQVLAPSLAGVASSEESPTVGPLPDIDYGSFKRPVVLLGNGARAGIASSPELLIKLADRRTPRAYTWVSFDLEPGDAEGNIGCPGSLASIHSNRLLCEADLLVTIGARLDLATTAFDPVGFASQATRIIIDIDDKELNKFPHDFDAHRVQGDAQAALRALLETEINGTEQWYEHCAHVKRESILEEHSRLTSDVLTVRYVALAASSQASNRVIAVASSGVAEETLTRFFVPKENTIFFNGAALGSMGLGLAHGIGAASGNSRDGVWIFEGDGGLLMNVQELATLSRNCPSGVGLFVLNNSGYASIANSQKRLFNYEFGASTRSGIFLPDWRRLSEAFGLQYEKITTKSQFDDLTSSWTKETQTTLYDLMVPGDEPRGPQLVTQIRDGVPHTPKLGELSWP